MDVLLYGILLTAVLSLVLNIILKKFDLPVIIGYVLAGAVISHLFHLHEPDRNHLSEVAEFGIVFLMFTIGLEFPLGQFKRLKREVFVFGSLQLIVSMSVFTLLGILLFDLGQKTAFVIGGALALSSTAIVLKILEESGDIAKAYGRQALGILLFQDMAVIPLMLMVSLFTQQNQSFLDLISATLLSGMAALIIIYIFGKYALGFYFFVVNEARSQEIFIESIFIIVLGSAALSYWLGFSYSLGAFFAGMMISETRFKMQVEVNFIPFRDLMLGIFFISIGLQLHFNFLMENAMTIMLLMAAIMLLKTALLFGILRLFGSARVSLKTALTLSQVGEFSFAILELSRKEGLTSPVLSQTLIMAVVFSMILTPFLLRHINKLTEWFEPKETEEPLKEPIELLSNHIIVIGYGKLGQHIVRYLETLELAYVAIDFHANLVHEGEKKGHNVKFGDATNQSILEHLHIQNAAAVIVTIYDAKRIPYLVDLLKKYLRDITIVTRIFDFSQESMLEHLNGQPYINQNDVVARAMVEKALSRPQPYAPEMTLQFLKQREKKV